MQSKKRRFVPVLMAALVLSGLLVLPAVAEDSNCQVTDTTVYFNTVSVSVQNSSERPQMVRVVMEVKIGFFRTRSFQDVKVAPNGQAEVTSSFWGPVTDVVEVGIIDDPSPL